MDFLIEFLYFSVKPTLKKVSKYENKFAKLQKKAAEFNFRNQLKVVKKKEFTLEEEDKEVCIHTLLLDQKVKYPTHIKTFYWKLLSGNGFEIFRITILLNIRRYSINNWSFFVSKSPIPKPLTKIKLKSILLSLAIK